MIALGPDEALTGALAGEHAAIYAYGPIGARLDGKTAVDARAAETAHRNRRDALLLRLTSDGASPPPPPASYSLPYPVTDKASALRLAVLVEERTAGLWRAALRETTGADRRMALDALTDCAVRATRFRTAAGITPLTVVYPGATP
jgi:hypothetical protein